jgi:hypothetical protein
MRTKTSVAAALLTGPGAKEEAVSQCIELRTELFPTHFWSDLQGSPVHAPAQEGDDNKTTIR